MLFADRLEVMNSGRLPPPLTLDELRATHCSLPAYPLIAVPMHLLGYGAAVGSVTSHTIRHCPEACLPEAEFEADQGCSRRR